MSNFPGVVEDPRSPEEKAKDFTHEELVTAIPLNWDKKFADRPLYSIRDQDGSGSCVGQAHAKALEILSGQVISAHPIYRRRANYPQPGMWGQNAGEIVRKQGTTTEDLDPSQRLTEQEMTKEVTVPTPITQPLYIAVDAKNIDKLAEAIETFKHCTIIVRGNLEEYASSEKPVFNGKPADFGHDICGKFYFKDENGEKCIVADESWGPNHIRERILTESYLKERGVEGIYYVPSDKPYHNFIRNLAYGMKNDNDVKWLQDILKFENLFPKSVQSTGNYFQITAKAVLAFQNKYGITPPSANNVGPKTRAKLNELYGS